MQVTQITADGLKREFKVTVPADEIESRVQSRLQRLAKTIRLPGFRPGKAPLPLLKKQYGRSILGEVLQEAVDEGSQKTIADNELRPAMRPKIEVTAFDEGKDLEFDIKLEVLPEVPPVELEAIALTRPVVAVEDDKIEKAIQEFAKSRQKFEAPAEPRPAQDGDQLVIDFEGKIAGEPFEGGAGQNFPLRLGAGAMVPGFEAGLMGVMPGETREVQVTFPEDYGRPEVAGKEAVFAVTVKEVKAAVSMTVDDDWAKELGFESLDELRSTFKQRFEDEYRSISRARLKRALFDHLAQTCRFPVPQGMVDVEFDAIWKELVREMERDGTTFDKLGKSEEAVRAEYRDLAERRVRLGLLLSEIGRQNEIKVENEEVHQAMVREAMRFPGQERKVFEFFKSNHVAVEQLRAPILEDKVCDFIFAKAKVEDRPVSVEELMKDPDEEENEAEAKPAAATPTVEDEAAAAAPPAAAATPAADTPASS